ncbi:MAG TPA: DUF2125 domain-containing protein [Rhizomicrobium sp.]|jgi:hypothetical protein|nr:DUF2125 domain-containing protein [Rhizomicrobium sp.]
MRFSHRFFLYAPFSLFVIFAAGVMIYWWLAANALSKQLDAMNHHAIAPGVTFSFQSKVIAGFPFRLDAIFQNLKLDVATPRGLASWATQGFATHALTYATSQVIYETGGRQTLHWIDLNGKPQTITFTPASLHASTITSKGALSQIDIDLVGLVTPRGSAQRVQLHLRHDPKLDALDVAVSGEDVRLAVPQDQAPLGTRIKHFDAAARLSNGKVFAPLLAGYAHWSAATDAWRKTGVAMIDRLNLSWGHLAVSGSGVLALDDQRRPKGILHLDVQNVAQMIDAAIAQAEPEGANLGFGAAIVAALGPAKKDGALPVTLALKDGVALVNTIPAETVDPLY